MRRRDFVKWVALGAGAAQLSSCQRATREAARGVGRILIVAFDGIDPRIANSLMAAGKLPNFARLAARGSFGRLATSTPPHTPVAFSSIISGADPGVHQIFDFIHRDVNLAADDGAVRPYFSTADTFAEPARLGPLSLPAQVAIGDWQLPFESSTTKNLRRGGAFWDYLVKEGVDTEIYYLPANYPTAQPAGPGRFRAISGMGTPDLLGTYGEFTFFGPDRRGAVGGGRFVRISLGSNHRVKTQLQGPPNFLRNTAGVKKIPLLSAELEIVRDPKNRIAKITISGSVILLAAGEWSDWVPVGFPTGFPPLAAAGVPPLVQGMVRMYLREVHPDVELYVSPINVDPADPVTPISTPSDFCQQLAAKHGRYSTVGIPEDTKALTHQALTEDEFIAQCDTVVEERVAQYRQALAEFQSGCLFFYFGATDLLQHMFWRDRDEQHPGRKSDEAEKYADVVTDTYVGTDILVGEALDGLDAGDVLLVFSDHGFTSFRRGFNLNSWLLDEGFLTLSNGGWRRKLETRLSIDWSQTKAYGIGMNGLYLNRAGREKFGTVKREEANGLMSEIRDRLLEIRDEDGARVIDRVDLTAEIYSGADPVTAPDMILGYSDGYRASWATILGDMPRVTLEDNLDRWSGTHLISADLVPGMLLASRPVTADAPTISDIAPTILQHFGIAIPASMTGKPLFASSSNTSCC